MATLKHQGLPKLHTLLYTDFSQHIPQNGGGVLNAFGKPAPHFSMYLDGAEAQGASLESHLCDLSPKLQGTIQ